MESFENIQYENISQIQLQAQITYSHTHSQEFVLLEV